MRQPIEILLVEDNPGDVALARVHLGRSPVQHRLHVVTSGERALEWLRADDNLRPRPHLIVLDLNLPGKSGLEVLRELKADSECCTIPVLIFTSSDAREDIDSCYRHHANAYVCKPHDIVGYREVTRAIEAFWFGTAQLPAA